MYFSKNFFHHKTVFTTKHFFCQIFSTIKKLKKKTFTNNFFYKTIPPPPQKKIELIVKTQKIKSWQLKNQIMTTQKIKLWQIKNLSCVNSKAHRAWSLRVSWEKLQLLKPINFLGSLIFCKRYLKIFHKVPKTLVVFCICLVMNYFIWRLFPQMWHT